MQLKLKSLLDDYRWEFAPIDWKTQEIRILLVLDKTTLKHSIRTSKLAQVLGIKLSLTGQELKLLGTGALLHDVGKSKIPLEVLNKETPLLAEEWEIMKTHPHEGYGIFKDLDIDDTIKKIVLNHHVWFNGEGGYPLEADQGPPCPLTQIVTVADVVDAMTSDRPYRKAHSLQAARQHIEKKSGVWFDRDVAEAFGEVVSEVEKRGCLQ